MRPRSSRLILILLVSTCVWAGAQEVTLPLDRYDDLRHRAAIEPGPPPPPAVPITLERAWLEIEPAATGARLRQVLSLLVVGDGWHEIELPRAESYLAVDLGGLEGRLAEARLTVRGQGRHQVELVSVIRLTADDGSARPLWSLSLPQPAAAVVAGVVVPPAEMEEVVVVAGGVELGQRSDGGVLFAGRPGETLLLNLLGPRRGPQHEDLPLRFTATSATLLEVARNRQRITTHLSARVSQGRLEELRVHLPDGFDPVDATGDAIAGWDLDDGVLVLSLLEPVDSTLNATLDLTGPPSTAFASPLVEPVGSESTSFAAAVQVQGDGLIELVDQATGRFTEPAEDAWLPARWAERKVAAMFVNDPRRAPRWSLEWASRSEVLAAQVDRLLVDVVVGPDGRAAYQLWLEVRSSGAPMVRIDGPPGLEPITASRDGGHLIPGRGDDALEIPLAAGDRTQVIHLAGLMPLEIPERGDLVIPLPALSAPVTQVEARICLPPGAEFAIDPAARAGRVAPPPQAGSAQSGGGQLAALLASGRRASSSDDRASFFPVPTGSVLLEAAWSALDPRPAPVRVTVSPDRTRREWF